MKNNEFVAYEYKNVTVKRESATMYEDCMSNFGWELVNESFPGFTSGENISSQIAGAATSFASAVSAPTNAASAIEIVQKYRRDRGIKKNREIVLLEKECEQALAGIGAITRKDQAWTMGTSLGIGIVGTVFLGFAVYNFIFSHIVLGILLAVIGVAGWAIGFFANIKGRKSRAANSDAKIQDQLDIAYSACERAHALLA